MRRSFSSACARTTKGGGPGLPAAIFAWSWAAIRWLRVAIITDMVRCIRSWTRSAATTTFSRSASSPAIASSKSRWPSAGLIASSAAASIRLRLSGKTRKIVPSAIPAASAISRVLTSPPFSTMQRHQRRDDRLAAVVG